MRHFYLVLLFISLFHSPPAFGQYDLELFEGEPTFCTYSNFSVSSKERDFPEDLNTIENALRYMVIAKNNKKRLSDVHNIRLFNEGYKSEFMHEKKFGIDHNFTVFFESKFIFKTIFEEREREIAWVKYKLKIGDTIEKVGIMNLMFDEKLSSWMKIPQIKELRKLQTKFAQIRTNVMYYMLYGKQNDNDNSNKRIDSEICSMINEQFRINGAFDFVKFNSVFRNWLGKDDNGYLDIFREEFIYWKR